MAADLDLGAPMASWLRSTGADVTIRRGAVPKALPKPEFEGAAWQCTGGRFLIRLPCDVRILVEHGERILYAVGADPSQTRVRMFLLTVAWGILAMQRGLLPLHASSVSRDGDVHAFVGPSGAGKSTLAAALTRHGLALFTDDILILNPASFAAAPSCFGHRTLYMRHGGLRLAGPAAAATAAEAVRIGRSAYKWQATPAQLGAHGTGRLRTLRVLTYEHAPPKPAASGMLGTKELFGRQALLGLMSGLYRPPEAAAVLGRRRVFEWFAEALPHLQIGVFCRRWGKECFDAGLSTLAADLTRP